MSWLDTAINNLQAQIATASASSSSVAGGSMDGVAISKKSVAQLTQDLEALLKLRAKTEPVEVVSRLVP